MKIKIKLISDKNMVLFGIEVKIMIKLKIIYLILVVYIPKKKLL